MSVSTSGALTGVLFNLDQIVRKQAPAFGALLFGVPGLLARPNPGGEWYVLSLHSGCVSYVVDGQPLNVVDGYVVIGTPGQVLAPGSPVYTAIGAASPDEFIDAHDVGAIEVYQASERPTQFGSNGCAVSWSSGPGPVWGCR